MGATPVVLSFVAVFFVIYTTDSATAAANCPPPSQIYEYSKKEECHSDSQCPGSKICCVTPARNRACVQPGYGSSSGSKDKYQVGGIGVYCGNVKCRPYEKCITDSATKRQRCGR